MHVGAMRYEILASTHHKLALRLGAGECNKLAGDLNSLEKRMLQSTEACEDGHWWGVLPEAIAECLEVRFYRKATRGPA